VKALQGLEDTKSFTISSGSFGFLDEHNEAGLYSSWGGFTNPLLKIANIFLFLGTLLNTQKSSINEIGSRKTTKTINK
jgi:hypothetical protein